MIKKSKSELQCTSPVDHPDGDNEDSPAASGAARCPPTPPTTSVQHPTSTRNNKVRQQPSSHSPALSDTAHVRADV